MSSPDPFGGWPSLPGDCLPISFSAHAVEQFASRCRPGLADDEVRRQLYRMLGSAKVTRSRPDWVKEGRASAYLRLGEDAVFPLFEREGALVAATLLTPRNVGPDLRGWRNAGRSKRRAASRAKKLGMRHQPRPRSRFDAEDAT